MMKMGQEKGRKNQYKGSQIFYVWGKKYREKITSDRNQLLGTATEVHRKCQQHMNINTEMNFMVAWCINNITLYCPTNAYKL